MAQRILSDSQFAPMYGGSRRLADKSQGPSRGYYVSRDPNLPVAEGGSMERNVDKASVEQVGQHFDTVRRPALESADRAFTHQRNAASGRTSKQAKQDTYQGIWVDQHHATGEERTFLDVSDRTPYLHVALTAAINNQQRAIYQASQGRTLYSTEFDKQDRYMRPTQGAVYALNGVNRHRAEAAATRGSAPSLDAALTPERRAKMQGWVDQIRGT